MEVEPRKLIVAIVAVFVLGVSFAVLNGFYTAEEGTSLPVIVYGISFLSIIVGAFIVLLFQWRINRQQLERVLALLPSDERTVIKILLDNNGHVEQSYIVALSGMHKVAVSRTVAHLEARGIIEKRPLGNTNMIILKL